jgi:hypothetical protein
MATGEDPEVQAEEADADLSAQVVYCTGEHLVGREEDETRQHLGRPEMTTSTHIVVVVVDGESDHHGRR